MVSDFRQRAQAALGNARVRANLRRALDGLMAKYQAAFPDPAERLALRRQGQAIRAQALAQLPELLEQLERQCTRNGIQVHWAETAAEGNRLILDLLRRQGADGLVKGKSMVSEEMELNAFLADHGLEAVETDLGEFIVQLAGERPSHLIAPAIHKDRFEIAELFARHFPDPSRGTDIEALAATAREVLRARFREAKVGLSGVNFAVAETGTLCLVENEGNGRLCTTAPERHIAVCGLEKVIARLDQLPPLLTLLTRSATGQRITTYVNLIQGPRRAGERDGPREVHLILLDNGRSRRFGDPEQQAILRCIRCGSCLNHCPVYVRLGGHAYGTLYPGPVGSVLEPGLRGLAACGDLAEASSLCGACSSACPVRIPLPRLLVDLRRERVDAAREGGLRPWFLPRILWALWGRVHAAPALYRAITGLATRGRFLSPRRLGSWTHTRAAPVLAAKTLHRLAREEGFGEGREQGKSAISPCQAPETSQAGRQESDHDPL